MAKDGITVGFIGGGEISEVMITSMTANKLVEPANVILFDPNKARLSHMAEKFGINAASDNAGVVESSRYVFSCVRPEYAASVIDEIASCDLAERAIVTVSAGIRMRLFETRLGNPAVARVIPTPPSRIGQGAIALTFNRNCSEGQRADIAGLFSAMGKCFHVREDQFDAVAAITAPVHLLTVFQSLVEGAALMGLDYKTSKDLVMQTVRGILGMWEESPDQFDSLVEQSATPGGISVRMLHFLDQHGLKYAIKGCIEEGTLCSRAFGDEA